MLSSIVGAEDTRHMFPNRNSFFNYKPCSHSFVILADKSKTACLGFSTISIILGENTPFFMMYYMFRVFVVPLSPSAASGDLKDAVFSATTLDVFLPSLPSFFRSMILQTVSHKVILPLLPQQLSFTVDLLVLYLQSVTIPVIDYYIVLS
jgi:hypothetical protein